MSLRICFVGDSFVAGTGDPDYLGWVGRVCAAAGRQGFDLTAYNLGVRRETSADIARRWEPEVACRLPAEFPRLIVFSFGNNDSALEQGRPRVPLAESLANLRAMLSTARRQYPVLLISPAPVADEDNSLRRMYMTRYAEVAQALAIPYLDVFAPLTASGIWVREALAGDGAHPAAGGYQAFADLVIAWPAWQQEIQRALLDLQRLSRADQLRRAAREAGR